MNPATGTLHKTGVLVTKPKDIGRLFGKSKFGTPQSSNKLHLAFIEAAFLSEEKKLLVYHQEKQITFETLIAMAASAQETFETKYLIFRDLRHRGHQLQLLTENLLFTFYTKNQQEPTTPSSLIATFSEREPCTIEQLHLLIDHATQHHCRCWLAIADEEGDITYYELDSQPLTGEKNPLNVDQTTGVLLQDRVLIFDEEKAELLHDSEFFGKRFGTGLQISLVEARYLVEKNLLQIRLPQGKKLSKKQFEHIITERQNDIRKRSIVFQDLKAQGLIVKTGFKFGNHFRAYTSQPDKTHAEYLVHAVSFKDTLEWAEVSRAIRLAHSVKKTFLFASIDQEKKVRYLSFKRIRP
jgi:tRNA-intron endonuclease